MLKHSITVLFAAFSLLVGCAISLPSLPDNPKARLAVVSSEIDELVELVMADGDFAPGYALAVYTPDGIIARGYGVTDIETGEGVSVDTAFYIASTTKAFTAMAMNTLHHRGELNLDATLQEYAPDAHFPTVLSPGKVKLRDFLNHTSGIDNGPLVFRSAFSGQHGPDIDWTLLALSTAKFEAPLGTFSYRNAGSNILTTLTDRKVGVHWQDLLQKEIFSPAGMTRTSAYISKAHKESWSLARPYLALRPGGPRPAILEKVDASMQSAGGIIMSASDALRWLELLTQDGMVDGRQIIPAAVVRESRAELVELDEQISRRRYEPHHYGLGWYIGTHQDEKVVFHHGGYTGSDTHISYMPDRKIGVAVFANGDGVRSFSNTLASFAYDRLSGRPGAMQDAKRQIERFNQARARRGEAIAADLQSRSERVSRLTGPLADYVGAYESTLYGSVQVSMEADSLVYTMGNIRTILDPFPRKDTARLDYGFGGEIINFVRNKATKVTGFSIVKGADFVRFDKVGIEGGYRDSEEAMLTPQEKAGLVGTYRWNAGVLFISQAFLTGDEEQGGKLIATIPGLGSSEIVASSATDFYAPAAGINVSFVKDDDGAISAVSFNAGAGKIRGNKVE